MGWLSKRGGRIHTWHKRWFVLTGDLLFYYKSPQVSVCVGGGEREEERMGGGGEGMWYCQVFKHLINSFY